MTIHRFAARRDANEPEIRKRFAHHGWHTEQVSGAGMPDLMCWPKTNGRGGWRICLLVDVKHGPSVATSPNYPPWNLSPLMLKHRAVCTYAQAVLDALPDANGRRDPGAVAWA